MRKQGDVVHFRIRSRNRYGQEKFNIQQRVRGDRGIQFELDMATEFLTISEVAKVMKVNPKTIYRAVWARRIPAYKVGKAVRIAKKDLDLFKK